MATAQCRSCSSAALTTSRLRYVLACPLAQSRVSGRFHRSQLVTGLQSASSSRSLESSTGSDAATQEREASNSLQTTVATPHNDQGDLGAGADDSTAYVDRGEPQPSWGVSMPLEEDWQGQKPFSLKDVDWGAWRSCVSALQLLYGT